jgi:hypothetical protein
MMTRRIFAGSIAVILLSVSSLAAACDLSCGFVSMKSDCHAQQTEPQESSSGDMNMNGMSMAGMTMPTMSGGDSMNQQMVSAPSRTLPFHAAVVDMGTCERQSCDQSPVLAVKANHPAAAKSDVACAIIGFPRRVSLQVAFHDARDGLTRLDQIVHAPLRVTLRV